ncbi:unnamed protein product [Peniophora sp. CBMAI 1063]|nr:unnamed protein product [Peniophora sp. CBMAI 1063]
MSYSGSSSNLSVALARTRYLDAFQSIVASTPRLRPTDAQAPSTIGCLEEETMDIRLLLSAVNERRNELSLMSMLPPEVMAHTIFFLIDVWPIRLGTEDRFKKTLGWVTVTHVCRRMRNICLEQRSLWARLSPDNRQPWDIFIERAGGSPLIVRGSLGIEKYVPGRIQAILERRDRIQELSLDFIYYPRLREVVQGLAGSLSHLRVLRLSSADYTGKLESRAVLDPRLLVDVAPALRCLDITGIIFPWGCGSASLTQFHYTSNVSALPMSSMPLSIDDIVSSLRLMPALTSLKLVDACPALATKPINAVRLPQLEHLHINTQDDSCWHLWSVMDLPRLLHVHIRGGHSEGTAALITSRLRLFHASHAPWSHSLQVRLGQAFIAFTLAKDGLFAFSESPLTGRLPSITLEVRRSDMQSMARHLMDITRPDHTTTIDVTVPERVDYDRAFLGFREAFMPASSVTTLVLRQFTEAGLAALIPDDRAPGSPPEANPATLDDNGHSPVTLFPHLRNLTCVSMNFTIVTDRSHPNIQNHSMMDRVLLDRSKQADGGIQQLTIQSCDVSSDWVKGWSEYVGDMHWDGEQGSEAQRAPSRRPHPRRRLNPRFHGPQRHEMTDESED